MSWPLRRPSTSHLRPFQIQVVQFEQAPMATAAKRAGIPISLRLSKVAGECPKFEVIVSLCQARIIVSEADRVAFLQVLNPDSVD